MKKGFTILEMILSIALVVVLGTVSVIGFNYVKKHTYLASLDNMSNIILDAVHVYIETNSEVKNQIYSEKNGVAIPLKTLENEGLVDFKDLDIEDEYVVTMLGASGANEECVDTYTLKSWEASSGEPIYICTKSDGSSNISTYSGQANNLAKVEREPYILNSERNYVKYNSYIYRICKIETDDSLFLSMPVDAYYTGGYYDGFWNGLEASNGFKALEKLKQYAEDPYPGSALRAKGYYSDRDGSDNSPKYSYLGGVGCIMGTGNKSDVRYQDGFSISISLKPCVRLTGGTGLSQEPYGLDVSRCN